MLYNIIFGFPSSLNIDNNNNNTNTNTNNYNNNNNNNIIIFDKNNLIIINYAIVTSL